MDLPELYKYGRLGTWFAYKNFFIYMIDGVYQSVIVFFFILYAYRTDSARGDGYDTGMYEMSTVRFDSSRLKDKPLTSTLRP